MTREDVINKRIEESKKEIEEIEKKIKREAKKLAENVDPKGLKEITRYASEREKLYALQTELYAILGTSLLR